MCQQCNEKYCTASNAPQNGITVKRYWKAVAMDTSVREWIFDHEPTEMEKMCLPSVFIIQIYQE